MSYRNLPILLFLVMLISLLIASCSSTESAVESGIDVKNVKANMTLPSDTGSFWMEITNNSGEDDALIGGEVDGCAVIELHDMKMENDVMVMREVEGGEIPIPDGETVVLKKGGLHVMCIGKEAPLEVGSLIDIALEFDRAGTINVSGEVVEPGELPMNMEDSKMGDMEK